MSLLGTCKHCHQVQVKWSISASGKVMDKIDKPEAYTCGWLGLFDDVPPSMSRFEFDLREGDCERCGYYVPAADLSTLSK